MDVPNSVIFVSNWRDMIYAIRAPHPAFVRTGHLPGSRVQWPDHGGGFDPPGFQSTEGPWRAFWIIVELHGGRSWLETTPGGGSTFTVLNPVEDDVEGGT